jgi:glycosyltransferase involved in cell wall biosynthesis
MTKTSDLIVTRAGESGPRLLFIDPYLNASHRALMEGLLLHIPARWTALGLRGRNFRWRLRGAACFLAQTAGETLAREWDGMVVTSMLGLAELKGLVPALANTPALAYFHENQLAYPAPGQAGAAQQERDLFLAFSNLTTAQAASTVAFNSVYHRDEFLRAAAELLARLPDARPAGLAQAIAAKAVVLPVPLETAPAEGLSREPRRGPLRILWNHRWSQDKDPETFFRALFMLAEQGREFEVAVLGPRAGRWSPVFDLAPALLGTRLKQLGPVDDRRAYWSWLFWADLAVSTALQEYQGLAVAEAVWAGCRPLLPRALVYPELYPERYLYEPGRLAEALAPLVDNPQEARRQAPPPGSEAMTWPAWQAPWQEAIWGLFSE